jgi:type IV secretory pathway TraG/TraD family ATPase VirD4
MRSLIATAGLALAILVLTLLQLVRNRLRRYHPDLFLELGNPSFDDSYLRGNYWRFQKFVWWDHFFLKDKMVHLLCFVACIAQFLFLIIWFVPADAPLLNSYLNWRPF